MLSALTAPLSPTFPRCRAVRTRLARPSSSSLPTGRAPWRAVRGPFTARRRAPGPSASRRGTRLSPTLTGASSPAVPPAAWTWGSWAVWRRRPRPSRTGSSTTGRQSWRHRRTTSAPSRSGRRRSPGSGSSRSGERTTSTGRSTSLPWSGPRSARRGHGGALPWSAVARGRPCPRSSRERSSPSRSFLPGSPSRPRRSPLTTRRPRTTSSRASSTRSSQGTLCSPGRQTASLGSGGSFWWGTAPLRTGLARWRASFSTAWTACWEAPLAHGFVTGSRESSRRRVSPPWTWRLRRPVLVNTQDVLDQAGLDHASGVRELLAALPDSASVEDLARSLGVPSLTGGAGGRMVVAEVPLPGTGVSIPLSVDLSRLAGAA